jgi:hypothetical protein
VPAARAEDYVEMAKAVLAPAVDPGRGADMRQADAAAADAARGRVVRAAQVAMAQELAADRISTMQSELSAANLVSWQANAIPASVADAFVQAAVNSAKPSFGGEFDPRAYEMAMKRVRAVAMGGAAGQALAEQKIKAVHMDLDARGKVLWSLFDLPDYAEEPYVLMAGFLLAPECADIVDANTLRASASWGAQGEMMLARVRSLASDGRRVMAEYF